MDNELLQPLLKAGLIDIGDSDERLANIEKSITDLQQKLRANHQLLPSFILIALDPKINDDDANVIDVESIIATHWRALRAKFSEMPVPLIRAVIINALFNLGVSDFKIARIVYLTAINFFPYAKLGREKEIIEKIITDFGNLAEEAAVKEWALEGAEPQLKLTSLKLQGIKFEAPKVDLASLDASLLKAIRQEEGGHTMNGHGPDTLWGTHFSKTSSTGIANSIDGALEKLSNSLSPTSIEAPINKFFSDFKKSLDDALKSSFNSISAVERRSKLLWWKETMYSTSIKNSYRTLNKTVQPIVMAMDLYQQLPAITPVSVDYLLRDTLRSVNQQSNEETTFLDLLTNLSEKENIEVLKSYFENEEVSGRITITQFIGSVLHGKAPISALEQQTGINPSEKISLEDITFFLLHDLMVEYLIKP